MHWAHISSVSMIKEEDVYRIGKIGKPHGVKGELSFHFTDDVFDRTESSYLILKIDGIFVPFFLEEYRFRSDEIVLVKFCDVDTQDKARQLTGCEVFFPRAIAEADDAHLSWAQIIGFALKDAQTGQLIGIISSVDDSTENVLFELEDGTLIPANEDLIQQIDAQNKEITIQLPDGLLDLSDK